MKPNQRNRWLGWGQTVAPIAGALAGLAFALWQGAHWSDLAFVATRLEQASVHISDQLTETQFILMLAIAAGSLALAFFSDGPEETEL